MGYTHYWQFKKTKHVDGAARNAELSYNIALIKCQTVLKYYNKKVKQVAPKHSARLSGFSVHTETGIYGGLEFNGTGDQGHETFSLREHFKQNTSDFCKTARKPYDVCVVACLLILKYYLNDLIDIGSDGDTDDLLDGKALVFEAIGLDLDYKLNQQRGLL